MTVLRTRADIERALSKSNIRMHRVAWDPAGGAEMHRTRGVVKELGKDSS